jgi:hypothetical protein
MKIILCFSLLLLSLVSCKQKQKENTGIKKMQDTTVAQQEKNPDTVVESLVPALISLKDSGQQYFRIAVQKNGNLFAAYEGDFPIGFSDGDNFTLELPASKRMLKISHLLVLYFNGITTGTFPVAASGNEKGKPTMVFTPEIDGNYGISVSPDEGEVIITEYSAKTVSGKFTSKGKDMEGNNISIRAEFINVKNNNLVQ